MQPLAKQLIVTPSISDLLQAVSTIETPGPAFAEEMHSFGAFPREDRIPFQLNPE